MSQTQNLFESSQIQEDKSRAHCNKNINVSSSQPATYRKLSSQPNLGFQLPVYPKSMKQPKAIDAQKETLITQESRIIDPLQYGSHVIGNGQSIPNYSHEELKGAIVDLLKREDFIEFVIKVDKIIEDLG